MRFLPIIILYVVSSSFRATDLYGASIISPASSPSADSIKPVAVQETAFNDNARFAGNTSTENSGNSNMLPLINIINNNVAFKGELGFTRLGRAIEAYYYPGKSAKKALVIGGVHGSELSAIEVARTLIRQLDKDHDNYYSLVIIPCLFPDNESSAITTPDGANKKYNTGRYTHKDAVDPNRQMPAPGKAFRIQEPLDQRGRPIEDENQLLLQLIHEYRPHRVVNLHAIRDIRQAGIFADPRTNHEGYALGYATDSALAMMMAKEIYENGGNVAGNRLDSVPTSLYYNDPETVAEGLIQPRNLAGSPLPSERGEGVSLGTWASTAVCDTVQPQLSRPAMRLITVEFPGYNRPSDYKDANEQEYCRNLVELYTLAIKKIFLSPAYEETDTDPCDCKTNTE